MAPLFGNEKATVKVRREVDYALSLLQNVERKGDFFYPDKCSEIIPRTVGNTRSIEHISTDELIEAMLAIADSRIGITKESLYTETARAYGYSRAGGKIQIALKLACEQLLSTGRALELDGKIIANKKT